MSATTPATLAPDLDAALRRLKLFAVRPLAPEVLTTAKVQRWVPDELPRTTRGGRTEPPNLDPSGHAGASPSVVRWRVPRSRRRSLLPEAQHHDPRQGPALVALSGVGDAIVIGVRVIAG